MMSPPYSEMTYDPGSGVRAEVMADALEYALWKETRNCANRRNSSKLRRQLRRDVKEDRYAWEWRMRKTGQDAHHIVPSGDINARAARQHMESLGISVNSAYNGVGLETSVHHMTYPKKSRYVEAINAAILRHNDAAELAEFLESVARDLSDLNQYAGNKLRLESEFESFLVSIEELSR